MKLKRFLSAFIISFLVYIVLISNYSIYEVLAGLLVSLIISFIFSSFIPADFKIYNIIRIFHSLIYVPYFLWQMIKANIQIALIVINPKLPINPDIIKGKTILKTQTGKLALTSSITLTPGTLSVDEKNGEVEIHCVTAQKESGDNIIKPFEKYLERVTE